MSHETIYLSLFVQSRGALRRELRAYLRSGRRMPPAARQRPARQGQGRMREMVMISERPAEVEDRAVPGHWEGDLLLGKPHRDRDAGGAHEPLHAAGGAAARIDAEPVRAALTQYLLAAGAAVALADLGSGQGDGRARAVHCREWRPGVLLRSPQPVAAGERTRTPTACCASTSPSAPISAASPRSSSTLSRPSSTAGRANARLDDTGGAVRRGHRTGATLTGAHAGGRSRDQPPSRPASAEISRARHPRRPRRGRQKGLQRADPPSGPRRDRRPRRSPLRPRPSGLGLRDDGRSSVSLQAGVKSQPALPDTPVANSSTGVGGPLAMTIFTRPQWCIEPLRPQPIAATSMAWRLERRDCSWAIATAHPSLLVFSHRQQSTITFRHGTYRGSPRPRSPGCCLARRSGHLIAAGTRAAPFRPIHKPARRPSTTSASTRCAACWRQRLRGSSKQTADSATAVDSAGRGSLDAVARPPFASANSRKRQRIDLAWPPIGRFRRGSSSGAVVALRFLMVNPQ